MVNICVEQVRYLLLMIVNSPLLIANYSLSIIHCQLRLIRFFPWVESSQDSHYAIHKKRDILNPT